MNAYLYCPKTLQEISIETDNVFYDLVLQTAAGTAPITLKIDRAGVSILITDKDTPGAVQMEGIMIDGNYGIRFHQETEIERLHK